LVTARPAQLLANPDFPRVLNKHAILRNGNTSLKPNVSQAKPLYRQIARRVASLPDAGAAQLSLCLQIAVHHAAPVLHPSGALDWLQRTAGGGWRQPLQQALSSWKNSGAGGADDTSRAIAQLPGQPADIVTTCYERLLAALPGGTRKHRGVYYTPQPLAGFLVRGACQSLSQQLEIKGGLYGLLKTRRGRLIDLAAGSGVFLAAAVKVTYHSYCQQHAGPQPRGGWNAFVDDHLLPAMSGVELMLPACALTHINLALALHGTGYHFKGSTPPTIENRNALQQNIDAADGEPADGEPADGTGGSSAGATYPVLIGNPPYSALTTQGGDWITGLMKGRVAGAGGDVSYFEVDGQPLRERKLWLHDDYVQFLRYAQYCIDRAGGGVAAMVTNRGFLDNLTFRGVRNALMHSYTSAHIVDLYPGGKSGSQPASGQTAADENVFDIDQGVAATVLTKAPGSGSFKLYYRRLRGTRPQKLQQLAASTPQQLTTLQKTSPPHFLFTPQPSRDTFYQSGWPLNKVMPVSAPAVVTARDRFVIGFSEEEVAARIEEFCDLTVPDKVIRQKYFSRTRSQRYQPGDTRSWKLQAARRLVAADPNRQANIRPCLYRAADNRFIYWSSAMIDWPRTAVSRHMLAPGNFALIARRQSPAEAPCNFFWASNQIVLDGVLRSDNRGGETFFPLYMQPAAQQPATETCQAGVNLSTEFRAAVESAAGRQAAPLEVFQMIYAQLHSAIYRGRFEADLRMDFPRIFVPASADLLQQLAAIGQQLLNITTGTSQPAATVQPSPASLVGQKIPSRVFPQWAGGVIYVAPGLAIASASRAAWEFRAGTHQICHKWLRDRRGKSLTASDVTRYAKVVQCASHMVSAMQQVDQLVASAGGFDRAFAGL